MMSRLTEWISSTLAPRSAAKGLGQRGLFEGTLIEGTIIVLVILLLVPIVITFFVPQFDLVFKLVLILGIYSFVRGFLGDSTLTFLVSGILIYFMAFKYGEIFTSLWFVSVILGFGLSNLIVLAAKDVLGFQKPVYLMPSRRPPQH
jgi:hypothetical protein